MFCDWILCVIDYINSNSFWGRFCWIMSHLVENNDMGPRVVLFLMAYIWETFCQNQLKMNLSSTYIQCYFFSLNLDSQYWPYRRQPTARANVLYLCIWALKGSIPWTLETLEFINVSVYSLPEFVMYSKQTRK